jgi:hypothetical protein
MWIYKHGAAAALGMRLADLEIGDTAGWNACATIGAGRQHGNTRNDRKGGRLEGQNPEEPGKTRMLPHKNIFLRGRRRAKMEDNDKGDENQDKQHCYPIVGWQEVSCLAIDRINDWATMETLQQSLNCSRNIEIP